MKFAVTARAALMRTVHVVPDTESHPLQPLSRRAGLAVSVTTVSIVYCSEQSPPQSMPCGLDVTLPWLAARPPLFTVSVNRFKSNVALTVVAALTVTVQVAPDTESHPVHPANVDRLSGVGVNVTAVPTS